MTIENNGYILEVDNKNLSSKIEHNKLELSFDMWAIYEYSDDVCIQSAKSFSVFDGYNQVVTLA